MISTARQTKQVDSASSKWGTAGDTWSKLLVQGQGHARGELINSRTRRLLRSRVAAPVGAGFGDVLGCAVGEEAGEKKRSSRSCSGRKPGKQPGASSGKLA